MPEVILKVGAKHRAIKLLREKNAGGKYHFWIEGDETALSGLFNESDLIGAAELSSRRQRVDSVDEAFRVLCRYRWYCADPVEVHPDFLPEVLHEVERRGGGTEEKRWKTKLRNP